MIPLALTWEDSQVQSKVEGAVFQPELNLTACYQKRVLGPRVRITKKGGRSKHRGFTKCGECSPRRYRDQVLSVLLGTGSSSPIKSWSWEVESC